MRREGIPPRRNGGGQAFGLRWSAGARIGGCVGLPSVHQPFLAFVEFLMVDLAAGVAVPEKV